MGMYRTFDRKKYRAYQEYTVKAEAKKDQAKMKAEGYLGRITYSKWATMHILWLRKKQTTKRKKTNTGGLEVCKTHGGYYGVFKTDAKRSKRISPREFLNRKDATEWMRKHTERGTDVRNST